MPIHPRFEEMEFRAELIELLRRYRASIDLVDVGEAYAPEMQIVVTINGITCISDFNNIDSNSEC